MSLRPVFRWMAPAGAPARLSILIFHRVLDAADPLFPDEPDRRRFDEILGWVRSWLTVMPLDDAVRRLREGTLPSASAAITFDDGYADNATNAMPALLRHGLTATFFVASDFLDGGMMWNDVVIESVRRAADGAHDLAPWFDACVTLGDATSRRRTIDALIARLKYLPPAERDDAVERVRRALDGKRRGDLMMSTAQLRQVRAAGLQVGAHTCSHPILARTGDDAARAEITAGKAALEALLGEPVSLFAYPNGKPGGDYLGKHVAMVREAGFDAAVSTQPGVSVAATDHFQLPRFSPWDRTRLRYAARLMANLRSPAGLSAKS